MNLPPNLINNELDDFYYEKSSNNFLNYFIHYIQHASYSNLYNLHLNFVFSESTFEDILNNEIQNNIQYIKQIIDEVFGNELLSKTQMYFSFTRFFRDYSSFDKINSLNFIESMDLNSENIDSKFRNKISVRRYIVRVIADFTRLYWTSNKTNTFEEYKNVPHFFECKIEYLKEIESLVEIDFKDKISRLPSDKYSNFFNEIFKDAYFNPLIKICYNILISLYYKQCLQERINVQMFIKRNEFLFNEDILVNKGFKKDKIYYSFQWNPKRTEKLKKFYNILVSNAIIRDVTFMMFKKYFNKVNINTISEKLEMFNLNDSEKIYLILLLQKDGYITNNSNFSWVRVLSIISFEGNENTLRVTKSKIVKEKQGDLCLSLRSRTMVNNLIKNI